MNKNEFLDALRSKLAEELSIAETAYHVQYYQDYIDEEISKGSTESEVIEALGSPEIIAKTLLDNPESRTHYDNFTDKYVTPSADESFENNDNGNAGQDSYQNSQNTDTYQKTQSEYASYEQGFGNNRPTKDKETMTGIIIVSVIAIIAVIAIAVLIIVLAAKTVKFFAPVIAIIIIIAIVAKLFKNR